MNQEEFTKIVQETIQSTGQLLISKGAEYSSDADRLANFKRGAAATGMTSKQVALIYMSKHYDALCSFVKADAKGSMQILSEPIDGRLDDLINYCMLMKALIREDSIPPLAFVTGTTAAKPPRHQCPDCDGKGTSLNRGSLHVSCNTCGGTGIL